MNDKQIRVRYSDGKDVTFYRVTYISYSEPGFVVITEPDDEKINEYRIPLSNVQFVVDETRD
jgi:hypothetical protein